MEVTRRQALLIGGAGVVVVGGVTASVVAGIMVGNQVEEPTPSPPPPDPGQFDEHASRAVESIRTQMRRIGAEDFGAIGNASHTKGYHLSVARLRITDKADDYSLKGPKNGSVDALAACAIDIGMKWTQSRVWVKWMFDEYAAGRLPRVVELIGSLDGKTALYAAEETGRKPNRYTGEGHIDWTHVAHGRAYANRTELGATILGGWPRK